MLQRIWRSLYGRISLLYLVLSLALGLACAWVTVSYFQTFMGAVNQRLDRELAANLAPRVEAATGDAPLGQAVSRVASRIGDLRPAVQLYVLDKSGHIQGSSVEPPYVKREQINMEPVRAFLDGKTAPVRAQDPASTTDRKVFSASPITGPNEQTSYLYVILNGCSAEAIASTFRQTYLWRTFGASLLLALSFTTVVGLLLFWLLTRRFRALTRVVRRFKEGNYQERVDDSSDDEIGQLGQAFNEMADTIAAQVEALRRTDEKRRRLVEQVSHDFRTPLASIQGHAEKLLGALSSPSGDGAPASGSTANSGISSGDGAPAQPEYDRVETILQNADRLDRLSTRLHELSRLDAQEASFSAEPFSLAELAHDLAVKFRPQAAERGIEINVDCSPGRVRVSGDIGQIERLLSNLIENALENTPGGGNVALRLRREEEKVQVAVVDTGVGIPEEEIPLVTQRFYRVDPDERGANEEGSGLGLAIASEIAEAHGSALDIDSSPGEGTAVRFDLPTAGS